MNKKRIIYFILTFIWCIVIFSFSHKTGDDSGGLSLKIVQFLLEVIYPKFELLSETVQMNIIDTIHVLIRKAAHMTEFAVLYFFSYQFYATYHPSSKKGIWLPFLFCVLYAASDECHQLFIPGRAGSLVDVGIDSCGALIMLGLLCLINKKYKNKKSMV